MTARTNQVGREREHAADGLIVRVLKGVNAGKVGALIEKALLWAAQARGSSVRFCGASFLRIILQNASIRLTQNFIEKYVLSAGGMLERATAVLL